MTTAAASDRVASARASFHRTMPHRFSYIPSPIDRHGWFSVGCRTVRENSRLTPLPSGKRTGHAQLPVRAFSEGDRREVDIRDHKAPISTHAGSKADWQKAIHICQPASFGFRVPAYARNSNRRHRLASSCPTPVAPASAQAPVGCGPMPPTPPAMPSPPSDRACRTPP